MSDLKDGESTLMQGSGSKPYELKNVGGVYSCSCPAWRNQSVAIERRTCKHLRKLRGDAAEEARLGQPIAPAQRKAAGAAEDKDGPPVLLAERWDNETDLSGWWMSEKLDGVRAYWDGKQFLSRLGNVYHAPDWFLEGLPDVPLDGELWLRRKGFQRTVSIARRQDKSDHWRELRYVVFDAPGHAAPFEARMEFFQEVITKRKPPFAVAHPHEVCRGLDHLRKELARVEALGGEGLMLRQPGSHYEAGRSATLLKIKRFHDAEARVIGHLPGAGRHKGRLGALDVELPDGTQFSVGTGFSDAQREDPPPVGSLITFRYQELSDRGVPRFPSFVRVRRDSELQPLAGRQTNTSPSAPSAGKSAIKTSTTTKEPSMKRRFEFVEGNSAKFWEISTSGADVTVTFGRLGTAGQTQTKTLPDAEAAAKHANKLIGEKTKKGYQEVAGV
ncbi:MAG TPA: DNA ligase [Gemmataceae bacterium]|nr:DNA ligase [Gemmataceae bacterium]